MKYGDLIQFEAIETVVQLLEADAVDTARRLVQSFVISDRMAEQLKDLIFRELQFEKPADNKGLLVVGNYGTGKSHLMALVSALAEHAALRESISNAQVRNAAETIAGRFKVVRSEIGAVTGSLRDILCNDLQHHLAGMGVDYEFPAASTVTNNKDAIHEMMSAFGQVHPQHGLLFVVDELLDYLRSRKEQALILDLNFLREMGEVCKTSRFRFMCGVQESLFDTQRFQFVADALRRVKDRFEQVRIAREDVAFVVAERLLKKDARQQALIREHLQPFAPMYGSMNERMDEFVRLFPVHPAYLDTFERVHLAEKREVLKTLSAAMRRLLDHEVPADAPGLIAYDSYWLTLKENPAFRAVPEIREVIERSQVLEARIQQAFTRPQYRPTALRIIHGLSVHRLTTGDIYAPLGPTAEELRDDLCLLLPGLPEKAAEFLRTALEKVLSEISRTVSGQFLSHNRENGQYYLDLKKDVDFDSLIDKKAEALEKEQLDAWYFDALARVMECADQTYVGGYRIWEHEVEWRDRKAGRPGYLFFGAPNERSTAQPPRDFYLYFLQAYEPPDFKDERRDDEVFFRLAQRDDAFETAIRRYAGAREQAAGASGANKKVYEDKADGALRDLTKWLRENATRAFEVTCQGRTRPLGEVIRGKIPGGDGQAAVRDLVNATGSLCMAPHFENQSPQYPSFSVLVTKDNRSQATQDALRHIGGGKPTTQSAAVLEALELLDGDRLRSRSSKYAGQVLDLLSHKDPGKVLTRAELVKDEQGVEYWQPFRLEPEFLAVAVAALIHSGDVVASLGGLRLDASDLEQLTRIGVEQVAAFKHLDRPRDLPLAALQELLDLLGLPKGLVVNPASREDAVQKLQIEVAGRLERLVRAQAGLDKGLPIWGRPALSERELEEVRKQFRDLQGFLESLQTFNTVGKLKNFSYEATAVQTKRALLDAERLVEDLDRLAGQIGEDTSYLATAEAVLPVEHLWMGRLRAERDALLAGIADPSQRRDAAFQRRLGQALVELRRTWQDAYLDLHGKARLGANDDKRKAGLLHDQRLARLRKLAGVEMMPAKQLDLFQEDLAGLKTCFSLARTDLETAAVCPHCGFRPAEEPYKGVKAADQLGRLDERLGDLELEWTQTLLGNLADPTVAGNIELLADAKGRSLVRDVLKARALPEVVEPALVQALQEVLAGLQKVVLEREALHASLLDGGTPCTVDELKDRFNQFLSDLTRGKDLSKVRLIIE